MSSQSTAQNSAHEAGEISGQIQLKRDEMMDQAPHGQATNSQSSDDQNSSYTTQATNFLQQTGTQVKHMAQGAADALKTTLGMNSADSTSNAPNPTANTAPTPSTNHPSNPSPRT
ncbi:late embryogenesis abundant protein 2-like [Durio zibethinus]|uniref:Late embryogenesis abundant protein 2-like n=1 Tax=Durio zibethinus TaxID=66656 RepID=A0A6P5WXA9_DURZI|nr:late embryogenesis abundant protein 2-like [Durio zibethinus]XP_022720776.1 late embryogenesis abundant protein 2-like [Durio zibethinus]